MSWKSFLEQFHKKYPGVTAAFIEKYSTSLGANSYEVMAKNIRETHIHHPYILDLGCSDGILYKYLFKDQKHLSHYLGIDIIDSEIERAKELYSPMGTQFKQGDLATLKVDDTSIDIVAMHLVLMLLDPIETHLTEIHRVLKPHGWLIAVIGGPQVKSGFHWIFGDEVKKMLETYDYPVKTSDKRRPEITSNPWVCELFQRVGFEQPTFEDYVVYIEGTFDEVFALGKKLYSIQNVNSEYRKL